MDRAHLAPNPAALMPVASIRLIRTAILHLALGVLLGALMLAARGELLGPEVFALLPLHREMLLFGWLIQLALGVAWWMFPKFKSGAARGFDLLPQAGWVFLNAGIVLAGLGAVTSLGLTPAGRIIEVLGIVLVVGGLVPRIKPFGR